MNDPNPSPSRLPASRDELDALLEFWFGSPGPDTDVQFQMQWFRRDDAFDDSLRQSFGALAERALHEPEAFSQWHDARGTLGTLILLDQLSRNLHRGSPRAFEADPLARVLATDAIARGLDQQVPHVARTFFYLPFEHSEDPEDQRRSVALFSRLVEDARAAEGLTDTVRAALVMSLDYARKHEEVIARFGRFPHRNAALARTSSEGEQAWLDEGGGF